jgi:hypothetical protein
VQTREKESGFNKKRVIISRTGETLAKRRIVN